ncbi:aryl hydrocarbon receptor-like [Synchiropus splendidus]|uniref:aryl hydrocarbon receptor-like n=1 Tax=Synchiropus splendidus TaxID=270530 RepID=UPI00237D78F7|nr:aryl hydrocarbon receptor-like [Synchiropus splendidus]
MLSNSGTYANKKRKKPVLKQKKVSDGVEVVKSNPSKRHRDRLNGELDRLTELLPFPEDVRSCLDKLSVLRLSVGYLRVKSYFRATAKNSNNSLLFPAVNGHNGNSADSAAFSEGDLLLQALNGFVMVVTSEGLVFYVSPTIKDYLGFQQSDVIHQSVLELIHTDDRVTFQQQLHFALNPPEANGDGLQNTTVMYNPDHLPPENSAFLERSFVCRFRCLLDNSSGFLALKFQGRLKYLHGQNVIGDNGTCAKPQLALFAIAMPVQSPSIVEIRSKMLLFQTKHKMDFTPLGIDNRGKIILGYNEVELCLKGSGYQFIHAADMMYCADNHIRMIKTGESGLTVFRLLSKTGSWVWVKSNAKLIYKGGRPEFIIAYQRALAQAEGEEYFRQRRLQLPFSFTTGEAVLYDTGPTVDIQQSQFNKLFSNNKTDKNKNVSPGSLLDSFLKQNDTVYAKNVENSIPVDQVFLDSRALVSFPADTWQEGGEAGTTGNPVVIKKEAKQSVMAMIDSLEQLARSGEFSAAIQNMDLGNTEMMNWEKTLKSLNHNGEKDADLSTELDDLLTNEIFEYIDSVLFKEGEEDCLTNTRPSCLNNHLSPSGHCEPQLFTSQSPDLFSQLNVLFSQKPVNEQENVLHSSPGSAVPMLSGTQRLSHHGPLNVVADCNPPPVQQLQLPDIFSTSLEIPELNIPETSPGDSLASFPNYGPATLGPSCRPPPLPLQNTQQFRCPQNTNIEMLQGCDVPPSAVDVLPPLVAISNSANMPAQFPVACMQENVPLEIQQLQQSACSQYLPHNAINGYGPMVHTQSPEKQTCAALFTQGVNKLDHSQQAGLACGQSATSSSCMFNQHFTNSPGGGQTLAPLGAAFQRGPDVSLDQSPPQASCYVQWGRSEPVVGTSAINQENANISPASAPPTSEHNAQHFIKCHRQVNMLH